MLRSYEDLQAYFQREQIRFVAVPEHHAVELEVSVLPATGTMIIFWHPQPQLLQLIFILACPVPPVRLAALESALIRCNHALMIPGFGFNHDDQTIHYRLTLPRQLDGGMEDAELKQALHIAMTTVRNFWTPLQRLLHEGLPPEQLLSSASEKDDR